MAGREKIKRKINRVRRLTGAEYKQEFSVAPNFGGKDDSGDSKRKRALDEALDIRKFEIGLYWTRATYFWTFIGAALAAYGAVQTVDDPFARTDLSFYLSCVGLVFSFAWYCVNRGSKQWQENWENHVDLLEDGVSGPLYKVVLKRDRPGNLWEWIKYPLIGPAPFSVSKINQITSVYIMGIWGLLLYHSLQSCPDHVSKMKSEYTLAGSLTGLACLCFVTLGKTQSHDFKPIAERRETEIKDPPLETQESVSPPA